MCEMVDKITHRLWDGVLPCGQIMSYRVQVTWTILGPHARIGDGHSKVAAIRNFRCN